ncbi:MAG TPA: hypothetical protein VKO18_19580 [Terriglobia bacterium]|nr:hypothetical protein [Terriglobia bacterium]
MKLLRIIVGLWLVGSLFVAPYPTCAEEIILKNGQKIVGTIVGYENNMFRVETDYGVALVRKDKVASIQMSKPEDAKSSPDVPKRESTESAGAKPARAAALEAAPVASPAAAGVIANRKSEITNSDSTAATTLTVPARQPLPAPTPAKPIVPVVLAKPPTPPPPPVSHPLDVPMPANLQEHVDGNTYFSDTFQFSMFKPPDWKIYEGVPKETGSGIMAMGTEDEQTLLIVDRQVWSGAPKLTSDQVEAKLRQTYQDYHRISEDTFECDGQPASRRTFTGVLDSAEWHGVAVHVIHGNMVFGIIGLTSAETFQFQEAIFNKIIKTFHFHTPTTPTTALPATNPAP